MDQRGLFSAVADRTRLTQEESADLTRAVLEGLSEQMSEGEAKRLATGLPQQLSAPLLALHRRGKEAHPIRVEEFAKQLSKRTGLPVPDTRTGTGAVIAVLRDALGEEEYGHMVGQLPDEYAALSTSRR
jgi:uncharacterized protein (DUF2267 family)